MAQCATALSSTLVGSDVFAGGEVGLIGSDDPTAWMARGCPSPAHQMNTQKNNGLCRGWLPSLWFCVPDWPADLVLRT